MNNFGSKVQKNIDNYKKKLVKKHPNLKSDNNDNDSYDPNESMSSWIGSIIAVVFMIMIGFIIFQILSGSTTSLKIVFLTIGEFL